MFMVLGVFGLNLSIDPFGVFGTSSLNEGPATNERYLKVAHLEENPGYYQHLIFGSSRSGMTEPLWIEELTGQRTYNLSVFSGAPRDMQKLYGAYKDINGAPESVTVGLDAMAFLSVSEKTDLSRRHHPRIDPANRLSYWLDYLLAPSAVALLDKVAASKSPNITFDWQHGTYALVGKDAAIAADHAGYMKDTFEGWRPRQFQAAVDYAEWRALGEWLEELKKDGVEASVFLQPMHQQWQARMAPLMPELRPLLDTIEGLVDLSALGQDDNRLWYEQRHYRPTLAKRLVSELYARQALKRPEIAARLNKLEVSKHSRTINDY